MEDKQAILQELRRRGITDDQIKAIDSGADPKFTPEQQNFHLRQPQIPQGRPQGTIVGDLLDKISPKLTNTLVGMGQGLTGTTPKREDNPYLKPFMEQQAKSMFKDPLEQKKLQNEVDTGSPEFKMKEAMAKDEKFNQKEGRLMDFESRRQAGNLRGELNQNDYIKRFQSTQSAATGIDSVMSQVLSSQDNHSKNAGDQALITLYNKILDPLSVVRESEYARTPDGQALMNRIAGYIQKVQSGGSGLTDADRVEIAKAAKVLVNNSGELYNKKISDYEGLAGIYGVDPSMVTSGFQKFTPYDIPQGQQQPQMVQQGQHQQQSKQLDSVTAKQFLQQAGGDKNKAREIARSQGYQF